jgi:hypothetical protein
MTRFALGIVLLLLCRAPGQAGERPAFGLVIGHNGSDDPEKEPLKYADDDAVRNAELFRQLGKPGGVVLLTRLDAESAELYPEVKPTPPTRRAVAEAMRSLNGRMEEARRQGAEPLLYLFYSGHGDVENNQGYVNLEDGRWTRDDILGLLEKSRAVVNHVVVDACKSYFLVFDRGAGGTRSPVRGNLLGDQDRLPDNTGVFLSTSSAADSHEWEAFQGGVFSHELRSAIRGAADADGDDAVSYQEAAAFVWTANLAITNRRYRPRFFMRPPVKGERTDVLVDLGATSDRLVVGPGAEGHLFVEDKKGVRLVDVHPARDQRLAVVLPSRRPLFVRYPGMNQEVELPPGRRLDLSRLTTRPSGVRSRGAEHVAFGTLFREPFGAGALQAWRDRPPETVETAPYRSDTTWLRRGVGIAAIVLGLTGGTMTALAAAERDSVDGFTTGLERKQINTRIDRYNTAAVTCYVIAGAALAGYLTWTLWPEEDVEIHVIPADGAQLGLRMRF